MIALEGDGSLLMQLGCLATVAMRAPKNLTMVVWDNGIYQITGIAADCERLDRRSGRHRARLGLANSAWAADEDDFDRLFAAALKGGPSLIAARIDTSRRSAPPIATRYRFASASCAGLRALER